MASARLPHGRSLLEGSAVHRPDVQEQGDGSAALSGRRASCAMDLLADLVSSQASAPGVVTDRPQLVVPGAHIYGHLGYRTRGNADFPAV